MLIFSVSFQCERMLLERIHIKSGPNDPNADDDGNDDSYGGDDWRQRQSAVERCEYDFIVVRFCVSSHEKHKKCAGAILIRFTLLDLCVSCMQDVQAPPCRPFRAGPSA